MSVRAAFKLTNHRPVDEATITLTDKVDLRKMAAQQLYSCLCQP